MLFPELPVETTTLGSWCRKLLRACIASRIVPGTGYKIHTSPSGTRLEILPGQGGGGSSESTVTIQQFQITSLALFDYFLATPDSGQSTVTIAKAFKQRPSVTSEVIDGATITYTYSSSNLRTARDALNNTQFEVAYPRYVVGDTILAAKSSNGTGIGDVDWIDLTSRVWARRYLQ